MIQYDLNDLDVGDLVGDDEDDYDGDEYVGKDMGDDGDNDSDKDDDELVLQVSLSSAHLQDCLGALSRDVIGRERSNFLFYSQFYEHLLQQETQLLHQREQVAMRSIGL